VLSPRGRDIDNILSDIYYNVKSPSSFSGVKKLYISAKKHNISYNNVKKWLTQQETHNLFVTPNTKFKRSHVIVAGYNDQWDGDLMDMSAYANTNDGITFLLVIIDIFSRQIYVIPLPNKRGETVANALKNIFDVQKPNILRTDAGKEFDCGAVHKVLMDYKVEGWIARNDTKANFSERVILTLKRRIYKYMHHNSTFKYVNILKDIVYSYNHTYHRSLQRTPASVTKQNEDEVRLEQYLIKRSSLKKHTSIETHFKFNVGDTVRVSHIRKPFDRGYTEYWSLEMFKIDKCYKRGGIIVYDLVDWYDEAVEGSFYTEQLQAVTTNVDDLYRIEQVVKRRIVNKRSQSLVKWLGWPEKFNSWIDSKTVKTYTS